MKVLSLCDFTGNMVRPWADAGHECWCVDIQHAPGVRFHDGIHFVGADVRTWQPPKSFDLCFAFPPCTHLAVSGARWFKSKGLRSLAEAIEVFGACQEIVELVGRGFLENPVSTISSYWRKPDATFNPCDYGDPYTKKTCLWIIGDFEMPPTNPVEPTLGSKMHLIPPSEDRANLRSETPMGFAQAVFDHLTQPPSNPRQQKEQDNA